MDLAADELERALGVARTAALEGGAILAEHLGNIEAADIRRKSSARDLVTAADVAVERHLVALLRGHFPGHAIEAEEEAKDAPAPGVPRWFLDPLDGTVNFVHGLPAYCVSIGLWIDARPQVGVVHVPPLAETFTAARGMGAACNGRPIHVSAAATLGEALLATGFPYRLGELANDNLGNFAAISRRVRGMRRFGSAALDLCLVAAGRLDGFWELHLEPHDVSAGGLIVAEAGGRVTAVGGGPQWLRGRSIVAAPAPIHAALIALLEGP